MPGNFRLGVRSRKCVRYFPDDGRASLRDLERRHRVGGGSHPKALREKDALCHFGSPAGRAWLNDWKNWRSQLTWRPVYAPPALQPLQSPFLKTSPRPQFRTDETAGMRYAFPNGVQRAHAHTAAAALSLCSDRVRSRPCRLRNDNQPPEPPQKRFDHINTSERLARASARARLYALVSR